MSKIAKKWANLVYLAYFLKGLQNLGKYFKQNYPINVWNAHSQMQNLFILNAKKLEYDFFGSAEVFKNFFVFKIEKNKVCLKIIGKLNKLIILNCK